MILTFFLAAFVAIDARAQWSVPYTISPAQNSTPQVAVDSEGNTVAVWIETIGELNVVQAATLPVNGSWSAPTIISGRCSYCAEPKIVADPAGNAVAIWLNYEEFSKDRRSIWGYTVQSAKLPKNGSWTIPEVLSSQDDIPFNVSLAGDPSGNVAAVWDSFLPTNFAIRFQIVASILPFGGEWSDAQVISPEADYYSFYPDVCIDLDSNITAVWADYSDYLDPSLKYSQAKINGLWSVPQPIPMTIEGYPTSPFVDADAFGNVFASWLDFDSNENSMIMVSTLNKNGSWSQPVVLEAPPNNLYQNNICSNFSNVVLITWKEYIRASSSYFFKASIYTDGVWSAPEVISDTYSLDVRNSPISVAIDQLGNIVATWNLRSIEFNKVQTVTHPYHGSWSKPLDILNTSPEIAVSNPEIGISPKGRVICVWGTNIPVNSNLKFSLAAGEGQGVQGSNGNNLFPPLPATDLKGSVFKIKFLTQTDIVHQLTWSPSPDTSTRGYHIYKDGKLIKTIPASGPFVFDVHRCKKQPKSRYIVAAYNDSGLDSLPITINLP